MRRALLAAVGLAALVPAALSLVSLPAGFPDGYVSPYDQATQVAGLVITYALLVLGLFTLVAALMRKPGRAMVGAVLCVVLGASLSLLDACPRLGWCAAAVEQVTGVRPDDGQGG